MKTQWEIVEGNSYYTVRKNKNNQYAIFNEDNEMVKHTLTTDIQCAESMLEDLSEDMKD